LIFIPKLFATILAFLSSNNIKFAFSIFYYGRILNKLMQIPYSKIKMIEGSFMILDNEEESNVPLHRIRKVAKNNAVVWERNKSK